MKGEDLFTKRFTDGIFNFQQICGDRPIVCVMGYEDYLFFETIAREHCKFPMNKTDSDFGATKWMGINIYDGDTAVGMRFGK